MSLFSGFKKKKPISQTTNLLPRDMKLNGETPAKPMPDEEETEAYFFASPLELAIYGKLFCPQKTVYWKSGDDYISEYKKGYLLFEQGEFTQAIEVYKNCLRLNPIGISARFEICESYLQLQRLAEAKRSLLEMKDFLIEEKKIAKFYRRMGYIEIEENNFKAAAACYLYSRKFENHPSIPQELQYITVKGRIAVSAIEPESVLREAHIPVLTKTTLR